MIKTSPESVRNLRTDVLSTNLCVIGGGLAGTCAAITAARAGIKVVLVQDRPVLGGNASSEVRLQIVQLAGQECPRPVARIFEGQASGAVAPFI